MQRISITILLCSLPYHLVSASRNSSISLVQSVVSLKVRRDDAPTREAFERLYNGDYDSAVQDFETTQKAHADDPFAVNHLLQAILVREIDREGALNAELYFGTEFLHLEKVVVDPQVSLRIQVLTKQALYLSDTRLRTNPDDPDALYARGVTRSLSAIYEGLIEKAWYSAFRSALGAYDDHKHVLELAPSYSDAKLVVGVYTYIVAALPLYERAVAFLLRIKGSKTDGIERIRQAANAGGEASVDAKTALSLFLTREHQYPEALSLMHELYRWYPHNFQFGLSEADLLRSNGNLPEAVAAYRNLLALGQQNIFPHPCLTRVANSLGQALRSQGDHRGAADAFELVARMPGADREQIAKAKLAAGEMYDLSRERDSAIAKYQEVIVMSDDSIDVQEAKRLLKRPYHDP